jgi:hypothetical protein
MVKCPFCQFDNEDGAIFCEQCKSDLGTEVAAEWSPASARPGPEVPFAAVIEEPFAVATPAAVPPEDSPFNFLSHAAPAPAPPPVAEIIARPASVPQGETPAAAAPAPASASATASPVTTPAGEPASSPADPGRLPPDAKPRLVVLRGQRISAEYPLYEGHNFIGRTDERPVDIDLEDQEPPDRIWSSRQHAVITYEDARLLIEDLNSSNGTFVNRSRIHPGQKRPLRANDIIQIGTVQMKVQV